MFWGSFVGTEDGPCLFWEKEWEIINSAAYCEKIVPLIDGMIRLKPWLFVMQDNALTHLCEATAAKFQERCIISIECSLLSWFKSNREYMEHDLTVHSGKVECYDGIWCRLPTEWREVIAGSRRRNPAMASMLVKQQLTKYVSDSCARCPKLGRLQGETRRHWWHHRRATDATSRSPCAPHQQHRSDKRNELRLMQHGESDELLSSAKLKSYGSEVQLYLGNLSCLCQAPKS